MVLENVLLFLFIEICGHVRAEGRGAQDPPVARIRVSNYHLPIKSWSRVSDGLSERPAPRAGRNSIIGKVRCRPFRVLEGLWKKERRGGKKKEGRQGFESRKKGNVQEPMVPEEAKCRGEYLWRSSLRRVDSANYNFPIKRSVEGMLLYWTRKIEPVEI